VICKSYTVGTLIIWMMHLPNDVLDSVSPNCIQNDNKLSAVEGAVASKFSST
jgi:hypothetical protein